MPAAASALACSSSACARASFSSLNRFNMSVELKVAPPVGKCMLLIGIETREMSGVWKLSWPLR